jgi:MtN3 and saliva related transmembrane protein
MQIDHVEALGLIAGFFGTFASAPQAVKIMRTKSAQDVSLTMFVMALAGSVLWAGYGVLKGLPSVVFWNAVAICQFMLVIGLKVRHGGR